MEIIWKHEDTDMEVTQGAPFESFGLSEATMRAIRNKHYTVSTPVQAGCIPPMLAGKDVIAKAPTGTGKTMAFGIPIIERIDPESETVQAVILAPTRELAMQITDEMRDIAVCHEGVRLVCLYGGQPIGKQIDALTEFVKRPQVGAKGLIWIRVEADAVKSSVDKFYTPDEVRAVAEACGAAAGDMVFLMSGPKFRTLTQLCALRLEVAQQLGLRDPKRFAPLWVVDFPMFEWDDETQRFYAMHHPFTSPKPEDVPYLESDPGRVRANAYDFVCNGTEIGGGSIRIHDPKLQAAIFSCLGFTPEKAQEQFGFLMNAFKYGAPPHGGLAFGFDRLCSLFGGSESIRDYIAFPKNNAGRDVMLDAPSAIDPAQLDELYLDLHTTAK